MTGSMRRCSLSMVLAVVGWGCASPPSAPAAAGQDPAPAPTAAAAAEPSDAPDVAAGGGSAPPTEPKTAAAPPEPKPDPLPVAPDGTQGVACGSAPNAMSCIPSGPFTRGANDGPSHAVPEAQIWVQTFYMDQYEVTYEQYKACEKAKECPRSGPRYTDFDHPKMPIQGISWYDARDYCQAQGKTLPTEAQWEKAARGTDGDLYPWGNEPVTCELAIIKDAKGRSCGLKKAISKPDTGRPWDVGSRPVGRYELYDMVGNSWEWVYDWYSRSYEKCGELCTGVDPKGPCEGADDCKGHHRKIVRGGSWYWDETRATGVYRRSHHATNEPFHHFGFRCAATVEQAESIAAAGGAPKVPPAKDPA